VFKFVVICVISCYLCSNWLLFVSNLLLFVFKLVVLLSCVLLVCKCVLCYCHRVSTQLQLTNIYNHFVIEYVMPAGGMFLEQV